MRYLVFFMLLALPGNILADTTTLGRAVIGATGGTASGGPFHLNFTVGQPAVGAHSGTDSRLISGYWWEVEGVAVDAGTEASVSDQFNVTAASPNPFRTWTAVRYAIPPNGAGQVSIGVYDVQGRLVKTLVNESRNPGLYSILWNGMNDAGQPAATGVYFVRFQAPHFERHRRVVMLK